MKSKKRLIAGLLTAFLSAAFVFGSAFANVNVQESQAAVLDAKTGSTEEIVEAMSLDEKISQMIIPAFRTWNGEEVTDLNEVPELADALRKHQYGGVILYAVNIAGTEQVTRLLSDLQKNNAQNEDVSVKIPYMIPLDEEGGNKVRIASATRMPGNMAVGATSGTAVDNAFTEGRVIGEELAAIGINVNYAPVMDVNCNPSNPIIGIRSFSDDPNAVATLGVKYKEGLSQSNIAGTYKHFPGHGDTATDSHIGTACSYKTISQLENQEYLAFKSGIAAGADMVMVGHITMSNIDGLPATVSPTMVNGELRGKLGYKGVVVTDALGMGAVANIYSSADLAVKCLQAGDDILLMPADLSAAVKGVEKAVADGTLTEKRIDESVLRILTLKEKRGILK